MADNTENKDKSANQAPEASGSPLSADTRREMEKVAAFEKELQDFTTAYERGTFSITAEDLRDLKSSGQNGFGPGDLNPGLLAAFNNAVFNPNSPEFIPNSALSADHNREERRKKKEQSDKMLLTLHFAVLGQMYDDLAESAFYLGVGKSWLVSWRAKLSRYQGDWR